MTAATIACVAVVAVAGLLCWPKSNEKVIKADMIVAGELLIVSPDGRRSIRLSVNNSAANIACQQTDGSQMILLSSSDYGDQEPIAEHFATFLSPQTMATITNEVAKLRAQQADQFAYRLWQPVGKRGAWSVGRGAEEMNAPPITPHAPRSSCPHRLPLTTEDTGGASGTRCQLLQQITGAEESLCIVQEDACRACMKTTLPTAEAPNHVVASLAMGIARKCGDVKLQARMAPFISRAKSKGVKRPEPCFHLGAVVERNGTCQRCWKRQCDRLETVVEQRRHCEACEHYEPV